MLETAEDDQGGVTARAIDATRMDGERGRAARRDSLLREVPAGEKEARQEVLGDLVLRGSGFGNGGSRARTGH